MSGQAEHASRAVDDQQRPPGLRQAVVAGVVGTVIEWYDYALYGAAASIIIGPLFFPKSMESTAALAAFATFAVGFAIRPLGGVVIGHIGDKYGRKPAMLLTIILMGIATVGMGILPTTRDVGVWAAILLVILRSLQGFGAGAELAGAMTLVAEFAPKYRRGFYIAQVLSAPPAGIALATIAFFWVSSLPQDVLFSWAWRIPFLISALLFAVALYIRHKLDETPAFQVAVERAHERAEREKMPLGKLVRNYGTQVLQGFFGLTGHMALTQLVATFSIGFMSSKAVGMSKPDALIAVTIGTVCAVFTTPFGGLLADKFGSAKVLAIGNGLGVLFAFPFFWMMQSGNLAVATLGIALGYGVIIALTSGSQGLFLASLFPTESRFSGTALARETNGALVAGLTPLIALALVEADHGGIRYAAMYFALCCASSLVAALWAMRTSGTKH